MAFDVVLRNPGGGFNIAFGDPPSGGLVVSEIWDGAAWVDAVAEIWDGAAWVTTDLGLHDGATWLV